jgi:hypothetical protein
MSNELKYYVSGSFVGNFSTTEDITLFQNRDNLTVLKVKIHKGCITNSIEVSKNDYDVKDASNNFSNVNNIQINTSESWPVSNNRIFSLGNLKLNKVEFCNIHKVDDTTVGEIKGEAIATVYDGRFTDIEISKEQPIQEQQNSWERNQINSDENSTKNDEKAFDKGDIPNNRGYLNFNWNSTWLKWFWYILALILLLYLLAKCTQLGEKLHCKYENVSIEKEEKEVLQRIKILEEKIRLSEPGISTCGSALDTIGDAEPWKDYFDLGSVSGLVNISYNMQIVPDRLEVIYDGNLVDCTQDKVMQDVEGLELNKEEMIRLGFAQNEGNLNRFYFRYDSLKPTEIMIRVLPNKDVQSTLWEFKLNCPK